jgi:hypothetical protein
MKVLTGAKNLEKGTPLFRAKDQSWRDAAVTVPIVVARKLSIRTAVITSVAARLFVVL